MKNVKQIYKSNMTFVEKVYLCYGVKAYKKFSKKQYNSKEYIEKGGVTSLWKKENGSYEVIIGVRKYKDIHELKGLIVHELIHATDFIMDKNDFTDKEFRAYCNQVMYQTAMCFIDDIINSTRKD